MLHCGTERQQLLQQPANVCRLYCRLTAGSSCPYNVSIVKRQRQLLMTDNCEQTAFRITWGCMHWAIDFPERCSWGTKPSDSRLCSSLAKRWPRHCIRYLGPTNSRVGIYMRHFSSHYYSHLQSPAPFRAVWIHTIHTYSCWSAIQEWLKRRYFWQARFGCLHAIH